MLTDVSGDSPATYAYSAFGSTRASTGSVANEVRFTGERTDTESGLEFLRARTYDPATGTFLQRDTWGVTPTDSQSLGLYGYTENNPVNLADPTGRDPWAIDDYLSSHASAITTPFWIAVTQPPQDHPITRSMTPTSTAQLPPHSSAAPQKTAAKKTESGTDCGFNPLCHAGNIYSSTVGNNLVNNPANFLHDRGIKYDATVGACPNLNWNFLGHLEGGVQVCAMATTSGQLGATVSVGGSGDTKLPKFDIHGSGGIGFILTNQSGNVGDQAGAFGAVGGHINWFGGGSGEFQWGSGRCGQPVHQVEVGPGAGIGGGIGGGGSYTTVLWTSRPDQSC